MATTPDDVTEVVDREAERRVVADAVAFQRELLAAGFAGITWPRRYGGQGLTLAHQVAFDEVAADHLLPTAGVFTIGHGMCGPTLLAHGTDRQLRRFIPPMLSGAELWCQLFSEPTAGSDLAALRTTATRRDGGWLLRGQKLWTSGAHYCDFGILLARTDPAATRHHGLTMFVLDLRTDGVTVRPIRQLTGGARFNEVFLDDARVPVDAVVGDVGQGWRVATTTLMNERIAIGTDSRRHALVDPLVELARQRPATATDPRVRQRLAAVWIEEAIVGFLGLRIREAVLEGREPGPEGSIVKLARTKMVRSAASLGTALLSVGATAWDSSDGATRAVVNRMLLATGASLAGGTDEVQRNIVADRVLGLPREPRADTRPPVGGPAADGSASWARRE